MPHKWLFCGRLKASYVVLQCYNFKVYDVCHDVFLRALSIALRRYFGVCVCKLALLCYVCHKKYDFVIQVEMTYFVNHLEFVVVDRWTY